MICGLVLAAGAGTRFGGDGSKLLAELEGRPLLEHAVRAQTAVTALERVVVVLGARADEIQAAVDFGRAETGRVRRLGGRAGGIAALRRGRAGGR